MACLCQIFLSRNRIMFYMFIGSVLFIIQQAMPILEKQNTRTDSRVFNTTDRPTDKPTLETIQSTDLKYSSEPLRPASRQSLEIDAWQAVGPRTVNSTLLYSAFHDGYRSDFVKVIGLCYMKETRLHFCQLWYPDLTGSASEMRTSNASVVIIQEDGFEYSACFINCPLSDSRRPGTVSIVTGTKHSMSYNSLRVHYIANKKYTTNFTMCLSPLHNFDDPHRLVEWIEFNSILGASHINIYNFTSTARIKRVLDFYIKQGIVSVHQWQLPRTKKGGLDVTSMNMYYYGQIAAYNDCLYRSKADSKFVVITDLDEFIVPRLNSYKTWLDVLDQLPFAVGYKFRHCYFPETFGAAKFDYKGKKLAKEYKLNTLQYLIRLDKINPHVHRGKYIARTAAAFDVCIHNMHAIDKVHLVDASMAFLHHYRSFVDMSPGSIQYNVSVVTDTTVLDKYGDGIIKRVVTTWSKINTFA